MSYSLSPSVRAAMIASVLLRVMLSGARWYASAPVSVRWLAADGTVLGEGF